MSGRGGRPVASPALLQVVKAVVAVPAAVVVAATVAATAGAHWWVFDLVASFRPQLLAASALLSCLLLLVRSFRLAAVVGVAAIVNLAAVWPYLTGLPVPAAAGPTLRLVTFNVGISNSERGAVMDFLRAADADLVILVESSFEWEDAAAAAGLPLRPVSVVPPTYLAGITVLVRPGMGASLLEVALPPDEGVAVSIRLGGSTVDVLALHPPSPTTAARASTRDRVLAEAGDWAAGREAPVVVLGDLNAAPWSHAVRSMAARGGLVDSLTGRGLQPTWPDGWGPLMIPIDGALATPDLAVAARSTGPGNGSAHRPLFVEFAPVAGAG